MTIFQSFLVTIVILFDSLFDNKYNIIIINIIGEQQN